MNEKAAKKLRKQVQHMRMDVFQMFAALYKWPLRHRIRLAWMLIRGRRSHTS